MSPKEVLDMPQEHNIEYKAQQLHNNKQATLGKSRISLVLIVLAALLLFGGISLIYLSGKKPDEWTRLWLPTTVNVLLLVVIMIQVFVYAKQWEGMQAALEEIRSLVAQNEQLIKASETQGNTMQGQLDALRKSLAETRNLISQHERAVQAVERSSQIAAQTLTVTERAYVGITDISIGELRPGQPHKLRMRFVNSGRTPAHRFVVQGSMSVSAGQPTRQQFWKPALYGSSVSGYFTAGSAHDVAFDFNGASQRLKEEMISAIREGTLRLFIQVEAHYFDVFEEEQILSFIGVYDPSEGSFVDYYAEGQLADTAEQH